MIHEETERPRPRPEPRVARSILSFDLAGEIEALRDEPVWRSKGHNAKTLVKRADSKIVLTLLREGQHLKEHAVDASVTIQVLAGRIRLNIGAEGVEPIELGAGGLLALEPRTAHDVEAVGETAMLVMI